MQDKLPSPSSEEHVVNERYHFMSLLLNLVNTFFYMVNTYIAVPTAVDYSLSLGAAATVCGVVIGLMAVAQVFSSVYFSAWSNKSYIKPLIFSSIVLLLGNTLYALAYDLNSYMSFWLDACSMTRAVNRRYISDCVPQKLRMKASAGFVTHVTCWEIANFSALCHINGLRRVLLRCSKARGMDLDDACDVIEDSGIGLLLCSLVRGDPSHKSLAFLASAAAFSNIGFRLGPPSPFGFGQLPPPPPLHGKVLGAMICR